MGDTREFSLETREHGKLAFVSTSAQGITCFCCIGNIVLWGQIFYILIFASVVYFSLENFIFRQTLTTLQLVRAMLVTRARCHVNLYRDQKDFWWWASCFRTWGAPKPSFFHRTWWLITTPCVPTHKICHFKLSRCGFFGQGWWQQWRWWQARSLHETSAAQGSQIILNMRGKKKGSRSILAHTWMPPKTRGLAWQGRHRTNPLLEKEVWARKVFSHYVHQEWGFAWTETIYDAGLNVANQWLIKYLRAETLTSLKEKEKLHFC